ncbi:hypothetical protein KIL84_022041 [Mauremys mutica]|uniref:Uncharacterized protein n=1 Tax=Mauremys mutica TaxID=74926 RepID=A0A9D4B2U2_9SAUR|nr:hypothetical protein KIL84_022041 [Mauremys mutica]
MNLHKLMEGFLKDLAGGWIPNDNISGVECYNPLDHEWKVLGPVSRHRCGVGVAPLDDFIYAVDGYDGTTCLSSVEREPYIRQKCCAMKQMSRIEGLGNFGFCRVKTF